MISIIEKEMDTYTTCLQTLTISVDTLFLSHVESTQGQL